MFGWFKHLIDSCPWKRKNIFCVHTNAKICRWLEDHTPMIEITCKECGFHDRGPIYADVGDWVETYNVDQ